MAKHGTADSKKVWTPGQFVEVQALVSRALHKALEGKDPGSVIEKISKNGMLLVEGLEKLIDEVSESVVFPITLAGTFTLKELIEMGGYELYTSDSSINEKVYPIHRHKPQKRVIELLKFDSDPAYSEIMKRFERRGLEPPTYEDALYFGIEYPEEQRKHWIYFLHKMVQPDCILRLYHDSVHRGISPSAISRFNMHGWPSRNCVYAGVRK
jgi:hypothetical protein